MADKYIVLLGNKERKVIAKTVLTVGEHIPGPVTGLESYWPLLKCVKKSAKHGGVGFYDKPLKDMGVATWKAWPVPQDGGEPVLGKSIDENPFGDYTEEGWEAYKKEFAEWAAAKDAEKNKPKPAVTAEKPAAPAVISASKSAGVISGGWRAKIAACLTAEEKKQMVKDTVSFYFG